GIWRTNLASANAKRLKAIQASGEHATARELNAWYVAVDSAENAAVFWLDGIDKFRPPYQKGTALPWDQIPLPARGARFEADVLKQATDVLAENRESLALFQRAAALKKSRYPVDLIQSVYADLAHLSPLKSAAHLLRLEATVHAQGRRAAEAVAS